jgi:hypothetical protein
MNEGGNIRKLAVLCGEGTEFKDGTLKEARTGEAVTVSGKKGRPGGKGKVRREN